MTWELKYYYWSTKGDADFCASRISEADKADLDLSSWGVAFNSSEPVRRIGSAASLLLIRRRYSAVSKNWVDW